MKRTQKTLAFRKMRTLRGQLVGIGLLVIIGAAFFITLFSIAVAYEDSGKEYFADQKYADLTLYGSFTEQQVNKVKAQEGVKSAQGRQVLQEKRGEKVFRSISLTDGINVPHLYEGEAPGEGECLLLKRNAEVLGKKVGDRITVRNQDLTVSGLIASPEYVYLVQSEQVIMADPGRFIVLYQKADCGGSYNEIVVRTEAGADHQLISAVAGTRQYIAKEDQVNYTNYESDLEQIRSFAYIFPGVFAALIIVIMYVMLSRTMNRERKQIGICLALGVKKGSLKQVYLTPYLLVSILCTLLGGVAAMLLSDQIIAIFRTMFEVPTLRFHFYPMLWALAVVIIMVICLVFGLITMHRPLNSLPAQSMRMRQPKAGKKLWIERIPGLWSRLSFHTRYSLKNTLRNKTRFMAVVIGMIASCGLIVFSLGFYDSVNYSIGSYFDDYANYDSIVTSEPRPLDVSHPAEEYGEESQKALIMPVKIKGKDVTLSIVDDNFDMIKVDVPESGVVIPQYYADEWKVKKGDRLTIDDEEVKISQIVDQNVGFTVYIQRDYFKSLAKDLPPVYNTVFLRAEDAKTLDQQLTRGGFEHTTLEDDKENTSTAIDSISILIWLLIACSVILGVTVLYSVGLIVLSAREYEYLFLGVMGYSMGKILLTQIKESVIQMIIAVPVGVISGYLLLHSIKDTFSTDDFMITVMVNWPSYLIGGVVTVTITAAMWIVSLWHIRRLDIVEGLKVQED